MKSKIAEVNQTPSVKRETELMFPITNPVSDLGGREKTS